MRKLGRKNEGEMRKQEAEDEMSWSARKNEGEMKKQGAEGEMKKQGAEGETS
jgi:hypothetical protein